MLLEECDIRQLLHLNEVGLRVAKKQNKASLLGAGVAEPESES